MTAKKSAHSVATSDTTVVGLESRPHHHEERHDDARGEGHDGDPPGELRQVVEEPAVEPATFRGAAVCDDDLIVGGVAHATTVLAIDTIRT